MPAAGAGLFQQALEYVGHPAERVRPVFQQAVVDLEQRVGAHGYPMLVVDYAADERVVTLQNVHHMPAFFNAEAVIEQRYRDGDVGCVHKAAPKGSVPEALDAPGNDAFTCLLRIQTPYIEALYDPNTGGRAVAHVLGADAQYWLRLGFRGQRYALQPKAALVLDRHAEFGFGAGGHEFNGPSQLPLVSVDLVD